MSLLVDRLDLTPVSVPLAQPVRTASGQVTHAPLVLLDLHAGGGVTGRAYLFAYTPLVLKSLVQLLRDLAPLLQGQPVAPAAVVAALDARFRLLGSTGLVAMALAGIDMVLWDALARAQQLPLVRLLGGVARPLSAYASEGMDGIERGCQLAEQALARGFRLMKIKIGYPTLAEDVATIRAVQAVLGSRCALAVDYNQSLSVADAVLRLRALDELGLAWIEEPTRHDDDAGHAQLTRMCRTPVQLGENWLGTAPMQASLAAGAGHLVMPDLMKIGGVSGWLHAAALAQAWRRPMSSHLFAEFTAHLMPVTPTAHWLEYLDLAAPLLEQPLTVQDGCVSPLPSTGAGLVWKADAVARWQVPT
jgi:mandelate racemase